jgi:aryl-alcohol dehydrogenase-like predicted oxidoreductase
MDFRRQIVLGRTGLKVSRLGLAAGYGVPEQAVERAFHEQGINYMYWSLSRRSGMKKALRRLAQSHREKLVVALQTYDHSGLLLDHFYQRSLKTLGLEFADVLILGWFNHTPRERVLEAARRLKERGLVRFIALSGHRRAHFRELLEQGEASPIDIFMIRYNAAHRGAETEVFAQMPQQEQARPGVTCYTATRWGQLLNPRKMPRGEKPLTAAECYRFVLSHPAVDLSLIGPANAQQLEEAVQALDGGPLDPETLVRARRIGDHLHGQ